jgi:hypothetical protein
MSVEGGGLVFGITGTIPGAGTFGSFVAVGRSPVAYSDGIAVQFADSCLLEGGFEKSNSSLSMKYLH